MHKIKKKYKFILMAFFIFFFLFSFKIFSAYIFKEYIKNNLIDEYLLGKYSREIRYDQFYLLNKNKKNFETYLFCTSACLTMNADNLTNQNMSGFNLSLGAGQLDDFKKFFKWILDNKEKPKKIFIGLENYSLSSYPFVKYVPLELEETNLSKIKNLFLDTSFTKFLVGKYIINDEEIKLNETRIKKLDFAKQGQRLFSDFFVRYKNSYLKNAHIKKIEKKKLLVFEGNTSDEQLENLNFILKEARTKNIDVSIFFVPIHESYLKEQNGKTFYNELDLIKKIFASTTVEELTYFNNFNVINKNKDFYEQDFNHINYDAAKLISIDLQNKYNKIGVKITRENLSSTVKNLYNIYEKN